MPQKTVVLIVCLLLSLGAATAAEEEFETRTFDVSALLDLRTDAPIDPIGFGGFYPYWAEEELPPETSFLDDYELEELIRTVVSPREWSLPGMETGWVSQGRLTVTATPAMLEEVAILLDELFQLAARRVEVRAELATFDAEGVKRLAASGSLSAIERGRLDAGARAAVLAEAAKPGSSLQEGTISIRSGALAALAQTDSIGYVRDMDVEIAQGSVVGDPITAFVVTGWLLNVRPFVLSDGSVWLEALPQRAHLPEPIRHVNPEAKPLGTIDFPVVALERSFVAGRVAPGETMALSRRTGGGARALVVLLLTPEVVGTAPENGKIRFVPTSALTKSPISAFAGWSGVDGGEWSVVPAPARASFLTAPDLVTAATPAPEGADEALLADLGLPILSSDAGVFTSSVVDAGRIRHRVGERERATLVSYLVHLALADDRGRQIAEIRTEVPAGRWAFFENGITRAFLADWDVEVAQEARVGDPNIGHAFGGILANLRLNPAPVDGRIAGRVAVAVVELDPELETRRTGNELTGIIELPRARQTMFEQEVVLTPGDPVEMDGGRYRLTMTVTPR